MMASKGRLPAGLGRVPSATLRAEALRVDALILAGRGLTQVEIADQLRVGLRTVERWLR